MKRIIGCSIYDTETSTLLAQYENDSYGRFKNIYERLYKTDRGEFFVSYTADRIYPGESGIYDSGICPLDINDAKMWCERRQSICRHQYGKLEIYSEIV
jgi:hypothetical protein